MTINKLKIVKEELDETLFWLEMISAVKKHKQQKMRNYLKKQMDYFQ